jgi:hypothetical protein
MLEDALCICLVMLIVNINLERGLTNGMLAFIQSI